MTASTPTIDAAEAAHFGALAADWWNPSGASAMLHRLNPARLGYIREQVDRHWGGDGQGFTPLAGRTALDVGCGAGQIGRASWRERGCQYGEVPVVGVTLKK